MAKTDEPKKATRFFNNSRVVIAFLDVFVYKGDILFVGRDRPSNFTNHQFAGYLELPRKLPDYAAAKPEPAKALFNARHRLNRYHVPKGSLRLAAFVGKRIEIIVCLGAVPRVR